MVTIYDYLNIAFYFLFIAGVGIYFSRRNHNTSDYFRGGGVMPWWVTGASFWMAGFSAWTFTGAAGKIYDTGYYVLILYYAAIIPFLILLFFTSYRFRRMRVVTPIEAIRIRFGRVSQQLYTWIRLPIIIVMGGISLNAISVFTAAVFGFDVGTVLIVMGVVVTLMALMAGSIGVVATDFVQMFLLVAVTATIAILALMQPQIGGVSGLMANSPTRFADWGEFARPEFIALWGIAMTLTKIFEQNNIENSSKYIMARNGKEAQKMLLIPIIGTIIGPLFWIIPPMAAAITNPDLSQQFPQLKMPQEASFLATAINVMPVGMMGLLISSLFAAGLTDLSGALNMGAGIFARNFYLPLINPQCGEKKLLNISKLISGILGILMITIGLIVLKYRTLGLFDLVNQVAVSIALPLAIPAFLGLYFKRTPPWVTWTSALFGLALAYLVKFQLTPEMILPTLGFLAPFKPEEVTTFYIIATVTIVGGFCTLWFFFTMLFFERSSAEHKASVDDFFERLATPIRGSLDEKEEPEDFETALSIGKLCLIYGGVVCLLAFIPNSFGGRICFISVGGIMVVVGLVILRIYRIPELSTVSVAGETEKPSETK